MNQVLLSVLPLAAGAGAVIAGPSVIRRARSALVERGVIAGRRAEGRSTTRPRGAPRARSGAFVGMEPPFQVPGFIRRDEVPGYGPPAFVTAPSIPVYGDPMTGAPGYSSPPGNVAATPFAQAPDVVGPPTSSSMDPADDPLVESTPAFIPTYSASDVLAQADPQTYVAPTVAPTGRLDVGQVEGFGRQVVNEEPTSPIYSAPQVYAQADPETYVAPTVAPTGRVSVGDMQLFDRQVAPTSPTSGGSLGTVALKGGGRR